MRRRCTCGGVEVDSWTWRKGVITDSGFHRIDGGACQLSADDCPDELDDPADVEMRAKALYEGEGHLRGDKAWELLSEQARDIWRLHVAKGVA